MQVSFLLLTYTLINILNLHTTSKGVLTDAQENSTN